MTVCTTAMTSQASEPIIVNMKMWSLAPTSTLMKAVSDVVRDRKTAFIDALPHGPSTPVSQASV